MALLSTHLFHFNYTHQNCLQTSIDAVDVILNFLNKCQNENNFYFQLFIIFSSCYVIAEFLLVLGVDCVGRRLSLRKISKIFFSVFYFNVVYLNFVYN